ncbi:Mu transposase C-terminal domain-containing protein [Ammoniphilus sp. CFH 90114]|uniref:Mu transposase C-terminal domain-containing protein n=1 Tax=Ammoniphilus sp. CFH 90114 TaxID=2493665 RepID=UPI00100EDA9F|nr:Mu transposase C-terminal domain-containing protein [Ammoniphilus sp. CFH 90114]RXT05276.1 DNA-binding protein [Ammoniphilus sp. CFH 90114]
MKLFINNIIEYRDDKLEVILIERILWISKESNSVVTISIMDEKRGVPVFKSLDALEYDLINGRCSKLDWDPYGRYMVPENQLSEKEISFRDHAWSLIKDYINLEPQIFDPKQRYEIIRKICESKKVGKKFLYKYFRYYWMGGKTENALVPRFGNCGGRGKNKEPKQKMGRPRKTKIIDPDYAGVKVTETTRKIFDAALSEFYDSTKKDSVKFAYVRMLSKYYSVGTTTKNGVEIPIIPPEYQLPSLAQFRYHLRKKRNQRRTLISREGETTFNRDFRPVLGSETRRANGPGQIFEVDATIADVYLVSSDDPNQIIGRPVVYMVVDVWSHMIVGLYVGLEGPSWQGMTMAIENTAADKVAFCTQLGIDITEDEWPCHHLPEYIYADRGEMESHHADSLARAIGVKIKNTPPYRPDLKGIIEQKFLTINLTLQPWMPGAVKKEYQKRGGTDYVLDAKLTIKGFTRLLIEMVLHHNNFHYMEHYPLDKALSIDKVRAIPRELWNWGVARNHYLKEIPLDILRLNVLPEATVTASRDGVYFQGMYFGNEELVDQGWFIRGNSVKIKIAYDRRCMNHIYIKAEDGLGFVKCHLLEKSSRFRDLSLEEIKEIQNEEKIDRSLYLSTELQSQVELNAKLEAIVKSEEQKTNQAIDTNLTKLERKANIKYNKKAEREKIRKEQYFELSPNDKQVDKQSDSAEAEDVYIPRSKLGFLSTITKGNRTYE